MQWLIPVITLVATVFKRFCTTTAGCACTPWYECTESYPQSSLGVVWINRNRCIEALLWTISESLGMIVKVMSRQLSKKERVSLKGVYVWGVSTTVSKNSDYFVWKDTSKCVTRRFYNNSWQDASKLLRIQTLLFWGRSATKLSPKKNSQKCFLRRTTNVTFSISWVAP